MKKLIIIVTIFFISGLSLKLTAQDFRFSQFNENSSNVNPALTGCASVLKATISYRDQWRSVTVPFRTYGVNIESRFKTSSWKPVAGQGMRFTKENFNRFTGGLAIYSDNAGDGNLRTTQVNLSLATFVPLNNRSQLSLGLQGSLVQRSINFSNLLFSNQYNGTKYDVNLASGESAANASFIYPDLAAGINWNYATENRLAVLNREKKANVGFAVYHLTKPKQSYLVTNSPKISFRYVLHGDFLFDIPRTNIGLVPSYLIQLQGTSYEAVVGTFVKYYMKENSKYTGIIQRTSVSFGAFCRYKDAIIIAIGYDRKQQFGIGISYDINISGLTNASKLSGGPEITLRFNSRNAFLYQKKSMPSF